MNRTHACGIVIALTVAGVCGAAETATTQPTSPAESPELAALLQAAGTCYSFGIDRRGSREIFDLGLRKLHSAEARCDSLERAGTLGKQQSQEYRRRIAAMRADLQGQKDISARWFGAAFPLADMLEPTFGSGEERENIHSLLDRPDLAAVDKAARSLQENLLTPGGWRFQQHLAVTCVPYRQDLASQANYVFEQAGKFIVHSFSEISDALSDADLERFQRGEFTAEMIDALCKATGAPSMILVKITETDPCDRIRSFTLEATSRKPGEAEGTLVGTGYGFCLDGRSMLAPIILVNVGILLASIAILGTLARRRVTKVRWVVIGAMAAAGFLIGRTLPWALVPLLRGIAPAPESLAAVSFWWPGAMGIILYGVPIFVLLTLLGRMGRRLTLLKAPGLETEVAIASTAGVSAYLAGPLLLHLGAGGLAVLASLALAAGAAGALLVESAGPPLRAGKGLLAALLLLAAGLAACHLSVAWLGALAGAGMIGMGLTKWTVRPPAPAQAEHSTGADGAEELLRRVRVHKYIPLPAFEEACRQIQPFLAARSSRLALAGPIRAGTTTTAEAVLRKIEEQFAADPRGEAPRIFRGQCPPQAESARESSASSEDSAAYAPFLQAFADTSIPDILTPGSTGEEFTRAIGQILEDVVPLGWLVFGKDESVAPESVTRPERFRLCAELIRKLAARNPIVLFLDNVDTMDEASRELTKFLLRDFAREEPVRMLILLAGHEAETLSGLGLPDDRIVAVDPLARSAQEDLLLSGLGLSLGAAHAVLKHAEAVHRDDTAWILETVAAAAAAGALVPRADGRYHLKDDRSDFLPVPRDLKEAVEMKLKSLDRDARRVLLLAACMGKDFSISVLAECLGMGAHELSHVLSDLETATGLLVDEERNDDVYAFRSQFVYQSVCRSLKVCPERPAQRAPAVVRQSYAQLALAMEKTLPGHEERLATVATLFYAAGRTHASRGRDYCLKTADQRARQLLFAEAMKFLRMARECADACREPIADYEPRMLALRCDAANLLCQDVQQSARDTLAWVDAHAETAADLLFKAARACHDAHLPEETLRLARRLIDKATGPALRANGSHLAGLAMARLGQSATGIQEIRCATEILDAIPPAQRSTDEKAALAQSLNSLAEQILEHGTAQEKQQCTPLLLRSLQLKQELADRGGQAMTYGVLGRCAREIEGNLRAARRYFWKNYRICIELGNHDWQAMQLIRIADCIRTRSVIRARKYYEVALPLAQTGANARNTAAALAGLVRCCVETQDQTAAGDYGAQLADLHRRQPAALSGDASKDLREFLLADEAHKADPWRQELLVVLLSAS